MTEEAEIFAPEDIELIRRALAAKNVTEAETLIFLDIARIQFSPTGNMKTLSIEGIRKRVSAGRAPEYAEETIASYIDKLVQRGWVERYRSEPLRLQGRSSYPWRLTRNGQLFVFKALGEIREEALQSVLQTEFEKLGAKLAAQTASSIPASVLVSGQDRVRYGEISDMLTELRNQAGKTTPFPTLPDVASRRARIVAAGAMVPLGILALGFLASARTDLDWPARLAMILFGMVAGGAYGALKGLLLWNVAHFAGAIIGYGRSGSLFWAVGAFAFATISVLSTLGLDRTTSWWALLVLFGFFFALSLTLPHYVQVLLFMPKGDDGPAWASHWILSWSVGSALCSGILVIALTILAPRSLGSFVADILRLGP